MAILGEFGGDLKGKGLGIFGKKNDIFLFHSLTFNVFRQINPVGPGTSGDRLASTSANVGEISLSKEQDASDALIFQEVAVAKKPIDKVTLTINNGDASSPVDYVKMELSEVYITSYSMSAGNEGKPHTNISLSFTKVTYTTTSTKSDNSNAGKNSFGFNIAAGTKS